MNPTLRNTIRLLAAVLLAAAGTAQASEYARIAVDANGHAQALQLAAIRYTRADDGAIVDLVGAVHIGDRAYYAALNDRFAGYDAVLYELIAPEDHGPVGRGERGGGWLSGAQEALTALLGLSYQLDEIDYTAPNFVHADLSPDGLAENMRERGESLYVYFWRTVFAAMEDYGRDPLGLENSRVLADLLGGGNADTLKVTLALELTNIDRARSLLSGDQGSAVIEARNAHALDVLRRELDNGKRRVAIFYGVAHLPDLEEQLLREPGFLRTGADWIDAWWLQTDASID